MNCSTVDLGNRQNCLSCGGPLPIPEVEELTLERSYRVTRCDLDITRMGDSVRTFLPGPTDITATEVVLQRRRI